MPRKPKTQQKESTTEVSLRDGFQTPNYATDIIVPFLEDIVPFSRGFVVWECASGLGKITSRLRDFDFDVFGTDLQDEIPTNFLSDNPPTDFDCIVTNPPFSIKRKFFDRCLFYGNPFALLIPADYSGWTIEAVDKYGCEKVIPTRRIDYITPNILRRIWEGEVFEELDLDCTFNEFKQSKRIEEWEEILNSNKQFKYDSIYYASSKLLRKYSCSYYHSMWLTWGFGIGRSETFVELTNEQKNNI